METNAPLLASCSSSGLVVYDCETESQLVNFQPHLGTVNSVSWSHNSISPTLTLGQVVGSAADDGKVVLTLLSKGQVIETLAEEHGAAIPIHSLAFSSDSLYIGTGSADGMVKVWNLKSRGLQVKSQSHSELVYSVAWNSNDTVLASGSMNGLIALHNTDKQMPVGNLTSVPHVLASLSLGRAPTQVLSLQARAIGRRMRRRFGGAVGHPKAVLAARLRQVPLNAVHKSHVQRREPDAALLRRTGQEDDVL